MASRASSRESQPSLSLEPDPYGGGWSVLARGLLHVSAASDEVLRSLLRVRVAEGMGAGREDWPDISGVCDAQGDGIRFIPDFPFDAGIMLCAILNLDLLGQTGRSGVLIKQFSLPLIAASGESKITGIFPSDAVLPENLLRFYVRFSHPMRRGYAGPNIEVLDLDGVPVADVLYRAPVELWDPTMTCLTVLLDPGRLKRGVGPNQALGPPLKAGQSYELKIKAGMVDTYGRPLRNSFSKSFNASGAVRDAVVTEEWQVQPPTAATRQPLAITFPKPMDWAELWRGIEVASETKGVIDGRVTIDNGEARWSFTPDAPWRPGPYVIRVSPSFEDICGNTLNGPFDGPIRPVDKASRETAAVAIPFDVPEG